MASKPKKGPKIVLYSRFAAVDFGADVVRNVASIAIGCGTILLKVGDKGVISRVARARVDEQTAVFTLVIYR